MTSFPVIVGLSLVLVGCSIIWILASKANSTNHNSGKTELLVRSINDLQRRLDALEDKIEALITSNDHGDDSLLDSAVQFARSGMSAMEIASKCAISQSEADLIVALHQKMLII